MAAGSWRRARSALHSQVVILRGAHKARDCAPLPGEGVLGDVAHTSAAGQRPRRNGCDTGPARRCFAAHVLAFANPLLWRWTRKLGTVATRVDAAALLLVDSRPGLDAVEHGASLLQ